MNNETIECPLCMEPMDFDDVDFYPCPCRYQICRFCWDKILNEENGLCPACRKVYNSESPASYKPRTEEEIKNKIKHSKKICTKKIKPVQDSKDYLSEYRVLQKNLIFVVGLPMRMAEEVELLKGSEYFGKCGKVYKVVINQNQTFPGPQGTPCLSAYVTYHRNEDALKTLVDLKKLEIDGRAVKLSLGTTKYCSQFLRNRRCTKQDCMYLHEMGDQVASFTKEDMAAGRHTEYEAQLIQEFFDNQSRSVSTGSSETEKRTRKASITIPPVSPTSKSQPSPTTSADHPTNESRVATGGSHSSNECSPPPCADLNHTVTDSLIDSFYFLTSQSSSHDHNINQQTNNNCNNIFSNFSDISSQFVDNNDDNQDQINQDTADIDFDPINISRLGLEELIANENMQRMSDNYNNYAPPQPLLPSMMQRNVMRPSQHDLMMAPRNGYQAPPPGFESGRNHYGNHFSIPNVYHGDYLGNNGYSNGVLGDYGQWKTPPMYLEEGQHNQHPQMYGRSHSSIDGGPMMHPGGSDWHGFPGYGHVSNNNNHCSPIDSHMNCQEEGPCQGGPECRPRPPQASHY